MKRILAIMLCFLSIICFCSGTVMAAGAAKIQGNLGSGKVQISVKLEKGNIELRPKEVSRQVVTIKNDGTDCYLRVSPAIAIQAPLEKEGENLYSEEQRKKDENTVVKYELQGVSNDWVVKNNVYYLKRIMKSGESVVFCEGIKLPEDLGDKKYTADFFVDAIQSANIIPDLNSDNPWGNVAITKAIDRTTNYLKGINKGAGNDSLEVNYNDEAQALISNFDEIFTNMPLLHPGDTYTEVIKLNNPTKSAKTLFISDVNDNAEILRYITVEIKSVVGSKTTDIYSGPIVGESNKALNVGTLEPGENGELIISAKMDSGIGNEASALSGHMAITLEAGGKGSSVVERNSDDSDTVPEKGSDEPLKTRSPKTGQEQIRLLYGMSVLLAVGALFIISALKRESND